MVSISRRRSHIHMTMGQARNHPGGFDVREDRLIVQRSRRDENSGRPFSIIGVFAVILKLQH
jgi:hypothetical protein